MSTEVLFILAGGIAIVGAVRKTGSWPANGVKSVIATAVLVLLASATNGTKVGPLIRAFGIVLVITAGYAAIAANRGITPARAMSNGSSPSSPAAVYSPATGQNVNTGNARAGKPAIN